MPKNHKLANSAIVSMNQDEKEDMKKQKAIDKIKSRQEGIFVPVSGLSNRTWVEVKKCENIKDKSEKYKKLLSSQQEMNKERHNMRGNVNCHKNK